MAAAEQERKVHRMKFAFLIMGAHFSAESDSAAIHNGEARIIGVASVDEACTVAIRLKEEGIDCIELCGAFGPEGALRVVEAVRNTVPVGYAVHLPVLDALYREVFGE